MASFAIEPAFWELFPQAEIGIVVARGIDNAHESSEDVKAALVEANKAALAHVPDPTISKNPAVAVWREAFQQFKTKKGARSSIEALLKRASGGREVGSINPLVDIYNTVSLTYALPCGGEDIDTFAGDLRLTVTQGGDAFRAPSYGKNAAQAASVNATIIDGGPASGKKKPSRIGGAVQTAVGGAIMLVGVPMLILPGPGLLAIGGGAVVAAKGIKKVLGK